MSSDPKYSIRLIREPGFELDTAPPGRAISRDKAISILNRLEKLIAPELLENDFDRARLRTLWLGGRPTNIAYLFSMTEPLFLFVEGTSACQQVTPKEFADYLEHREPWEEFDYYICPFDGTWCWCLTHDNLMVLFGNANETPPAGSLRD